jgi:hypothetical protein
MWRYATNAPAKIRIVCIITILNGSFCIVKCRNIRKTTIFIYIMNENYG